MKHNMNHMKETEYFGSILRFLEVINFIKFPTFFSHLFKLQFE